MSFTGGISSPRWGRIWQPVCRWMRWVRQSPIRCGSRGRALSGRATQIHGEVSYIDHFGNLFTSIRVEDLTGVEVLSVELAGVHIPGMVETFGQRETGEIIALYSSTNELLIARVNGSAAEKLGARIGDPVVVTLS